MSHTTLVVTGLMILLACYHASNIGRLIAEQTQKSKLVPLSVSAFGMIAMCCMALWISSEEREVPQVSYAKLGAGDFPIKSTFCTIQGGMPRQCAFIEVSPKTYEIVELPTENQYEHAFNGYIVQGKNGMKRIIRVSRYQNQFGPENVSLVILSERESAEQFLNRATQIPVDL